jgi:hypothetical protein
MEQNCLAKSLLPGNSVTQEVVGYVAFQNLALTLDASERTDSNDLVLGSTWPPTHQNVMATLTATMASRLYSCVTCFQAGNMLSRLTGRIYKALPLDMIACMEMISTIQN